MEHGVAMRDHLCGWVADEKREVRLIGNPFKSADAFRRLLLGLRIRACFPKPGVPAITPGNFRA
jgi:hypothetical protein